ncbi:MAG: hypothetical protein ACO22V_10185 [Hylemonella sp.]
MQHVLATAAARPAGRPSALSWLARSTHSACKLAVLGLLACGPVLALAQNTPMPASLSAQERLDAIRLGLVEASLQTPTRVQSTTWIDSRGGLHEMSVFNNTLQTQGVRVLGFARDADGQAKAQLQLTQGKTDPAPARARTKSAASTSQERPCPTPVFNNGLRHAIRFSLHLSPDIYPLLSQLMPDLLHEQWLSSSTPGQTWQLVPDLARPLINQDITSYERTLLGNPAENQPWHASLELSSQLRQTSSDSGWNPWRQASTQLLLRMVLRLTPMDRAGPVRQEQALLILALDTDEWRRPSLQADSLALLRSQLQQWQQGFSQWLQCEPVQPQVSKAAGNKLKLSAGTLVGVQRGDEWLIADPKRFPQRLLEQDGGSPSLLARVDAVGTNESILTVLAGPADSVQAHWRAWPTGSVPKATPAPPEPPSKPTPSREKAKP